MLIIRKRTVQLLEKVQLCVRTYDCRMYSISFTVTKKKFCLSLHYNGADSYLFVNGTEIHKFKAKDSEIVATP